MNIYLRNLISEDERRRISNLHNSKIKSEFKKLLSEQDPNLVQRNDPDLSKEMNKFNEGAFDLEDFIAAAKEQVDGFPEDGYVVNIPKHGMVWGVRTKLQDGTVGVKYYLKQDGTVVGPDMTTISKNKWYTTPIQVKGDKMATLKPTEIQSKTSPDAFVSTPSVTGSGAQGMMTGREIKQGRGALKRELKSAKKQLKKESRKNVQNCLAYFKNWEKDWNQKDEALQVIVKETSPNYKAYATFLSSCCNILTENGKQPALVGLCSTKGVEPETVLGSGPTIPAANNPVSGAPVSGTEVTGAIPPSSSIANTPVGVGMPTQGATTVKTPQGGTTKSREDQEMIDQGLGQ
jgi:hypothetical protein